MSKDFHSWKRIDELVKEKLVPQIDAADYDAILAITRGGMIPACLVSELLDIRNVLTAAVMFYTDVEKTLEEPIFLQFPSDPLLVGKRVLIVDDVWDSGKTAHGVREKVRRAGGHPKVAVIHYKPTQSRFPGDGPDFYAAETDQWIVYPWDPDRDRLLEEEGVTADKVMG
ncbi:MAG: phosphoribosyltransferase [Chloroflexota bacterium]|nr:phosphoribosyltransferase [Chloroflexota bacterium]